MLFQTNGKGTESSGQMMTMQSNRIITWASKRRLSGMTSLVSQQMLLPCKRLSTIKTVVGSLWLDALVLLDVLGEVLAPAVGLGAALVGAVQAAAGAA